MFILLLGSLCLILKYFVNISCNLRINTNHESYIDVKYHEKWFCRRCYETIAENVLIPGEDNGVFFPVGWQNRYPSVFHFMRCKKCGERTDRDLLTEEEFHISQA